LFENLDDLPSHLLLVTGQVDRISDFFLGFNIPLNLAIKRWTFSCFSVGIFFTNGVNFDIKPISWKKFFIYVRARFTNG
jgi:hypothetical protein